MTLKNGFGKCFLFALSTKENPTMEQALFDWSIVLQYDVKVKYQLIKRRFFGHELFSAEYSLNQPKATHICSRVFISSSNKNRSYPNTVAAG